MSELYTTIGVIRAKSRLFSTPAFPPGSGPEFVNAVLSLETDAAPDVVLEKLHAIEAKVGRERNERWAPRTLDLDLLAIGDMVRPDPDILRDWMKMPLEHQATQAPSELILPHPRMHERAFVLVPLMDVAPEWKHPVTGLSVRQMHAALDPAEVVAVKPLVNPENRP